MQTIQDNATGRRPRQTDVATVDPDELIEAADAAAMLRVKPQTLALWRVERRGPRWLKVGRRVLYRQADINAWLAAQLCELA